MGFPPPLLVAVGRSSTIWPHSHNFLQRGGGTSSPVGHRKHHALHGFVLICIFILQSVIRVPRFPLREQGGRQSKEMLVSKGEHVHEIHSTSSFSQTDSSPTTRLGSDVRSSGLGGCHPSRESQMQFCSGKKTIIKDEPYNQDKARQQ